MRGLDPRIHRFWKDGSPGHKGVYARLQRAMPGDDEFEGLLKPAGALGKAAKFRLRP